MKTFMQRLLLAIFMVAFSACLVCAQTNTVKHVVDRGETLASIAKQYATTEDKLKELNPNASQFVYVGMELIVPVNTSTSKDEPMAISKNETFMADSNRGNESYQMRNDYLKKKNWEYSVFAGISMNNFTGKDAKNLDMLCGFHAGVSASYFFHENIFAEGSIALATKGYKKDETMSSGDVWDDEGANYESSTSKKYMSYNVELPILIGYNFIVNENLSFRIKVGPYMTYVISGKEKTKGYTTIYSDIHSSETEYINKKKKVKDIDGFNHFGYGIHTGISANYKCLVVSASYQRAFSKIIDKQKSYEQNILLSIGYKF